MCRILAELLEKDQTLLSAELHKLEYACGHTSEDVRLTAEILAKTRQKTRELGLDPLDTSGKELYLAINNLIKTHEDFLNKRLGISYENDSEYVSNIIKSIKTLDIPKKVWAIKPSCLKKMLKNSPPKKVKSLLGYRSMESMLKRESAAVILSLAVLCESDKWFDKFTNQYKDIMPSDFEDKVVEFVELLDHVSYEKLKPYTTKIQSNIFTICEAGVVPVLPLPIKPRSGFTIALLALIIQSINELRQYSTYFKLHQMKADFSEIIVRAARQDKSDHIIVAGLKFDWDNLFGHFGQNKIRYPEVLDPHVTAEDLAWKKSEELLYKLEPALHFWSGMDFVAALEDKKPISFNMLDAAINCANNIAFEHRIYNHMQKSLNNTLYIRYIGTDSIERQAVRELDDRISEAVTREFSVGVV